MKSPTPTMTLFLFLAGLLSLLLVISSCRTAKTADPDGVAQAVQATLTAWPTSPPRIVEVTRIVAVVRNPAAAPGAQAVGSPTPNPPVNDAPAPSPEPTALALTEGAQESPDSVEDALVALVNQQRAAHGLSPLTIADELIRAARRHSNDMAAYELLHHRGSDGSTYAQRIREAGYPALDSNEAVFWGTPRPEEVVAWLIQDEAHRVILLSPGFTEIGVSHTQMDSGRWQHYWTLDFGKRADGSTQPAPTQAAPLRPQPSDPPTPAPTVLAVVNGTAPSEDGCPATSAQQYDRIPMMSIDNTHPADQHGDLNLALRGYIASPGAATLIDMAGPTDGDAPQFTTLFGQQAGRSLTAAYQVYDWNWGCGGDGCRGGPLRNVEVTLVGVAATPSEAIYAPRRQNEIYGGGYLAVILYADTNRLTLGYTREGSVAHGYAVHLEALCVDPNLLTAYRTANAAGRGWLPAVRAHDLVGRAAGGVVLVAMRDRGSFMDPRSRKDWWR
ncbi:MAG: hypothetical protein DYG89_13995 [Caldilinea sp. CFX5]|nr:hypothetical protein [Caldilinea sp. CFX5]